MLFPVFTPELLLAILVALTTSTWLIELLRRRRRIEAVRALARTWRMNYGRRDLLRLTARVARGFPVPGAAALRVFDVIYGIEGDSYRYIFTAQFTMGVTGSKRRQTQIATFAEPRDRRTQTGEAEVLLADPHLSLMEQYRSLGPSEVPPEADAATHPTPGELTDRSGSETEMDLTDS